MPRRARSVSRALTLTALTALLAGAAGCDDEVEPAEVWSGELVPCDPREAPCVARLARGLAEIHGVAWPRDIEVEVVEVTGSNPAPPFPWWWAEVGAASSPFDVLDRTAPPIVRPVGSVRLFGDRKLVFRINPRVETDAAVRHRVGLIQALGPHLRGRATPGHPIDAYGSFPTRTQLRAGVRAAQALMIEQAIQRAAEGESPWSFSEREIDKARALRAEEGGPELVALARLYDLHDPRDPRALLLGLPAAIGDGCLIGLDLDEADRCVQVAPAVLADEIDGFVARSADAADGVLLEEALLEAGHPAAALALTLRAHLGRDYSRADGAGVRRDTFVFADGGAADAFAAALAQGFDGDPAWTAAGEGVWRFAGDDDALPGEAGLAVQGAEVVLVAATDGVDTAPFFEGAGVVVEPLRDAPVLPDIACGDHGAELPCNVRAACCRERLVAEAEALLGPLPEVSMRVVDPETAVQLYLGPQWADDRMSSQTTATVRFASGVDHSLRDNNDAAGEEHARRVLAWYYNTLRSVVMVVPDEPLGDDELMRMNETIVHELVHAWQDGRYGLSAVRLGAREVSSDAEAAMVSRLEGTAEIVAEVFKVRASGGDVDAIDWGAWAAEIIDLIAPAIEGAEEPARTHAPWLPYVGGLAASAMSFDANGDLSAVGDRVETILPSTGAALAELYGATAADPDLGPVPGVGEVPAIERLSGTVLAHRGYIGPWPLALRLAPHLGGQGAIDAVLGLTSSREAVALHPEGPITWIDVSAAFGEDALVDGLDGLGAALAERLGAEYRLVRSAGRATLVVGPRAELLDDALAAIR